MVNYIVTGNGRHVPFILQKNKSVCKPLTHTKYFTTNITSNGLFLFTKFFKIIRIAKNLLIIIKLTVYQFLCSTKVDKINSRQGIIGCASIINQGRNSINYFAKIIKFFLKFREVNK